MSTVTCAAPDSISAVDRTAGSEAAIVWLDSACRADIMAVWEAIERECGTLPLMASSVWTETWLRYYGNLVPHRVAGLQVGGQYVGIALLTFGVEEHQNWTGERVWHVGTAGEPDQDSVCVEYNALACRPERRDELLKKLFTALSQESNWDAWKLDGFVAEDLPTWITAEAGWQVVTKPARWVDLDHVRESGRELIQFFGDSTRKGIRQNLKKMDSVRFECAHDTEHAQDILTDLIRLHQHRWNSVGEPGCYASERFVQFHRELIDRLVPTGELLLMRISSSEQVIGCSQILVDRGRAMVYQGGRICTESGSPGLVTDYLCMQECLHRGCSAFDFMAGDSMHKLRLTSQQTPLVWATWERPRWKYRLRESLRATRNWFKRYAPGRGSLKAVSVTEQGDQTP